MLQNNLPANIKKSEEILQDNLSVNTKKPEEYHKIIYQKNIKEPEKISQDNLLVKYQKNTTRQFTSKSKRLKEIPQDNSSEKY